MQIASLSRRELLLGCGAAFLVSGATSKASPSTVVVWTEGDHIGLVKSGNRWQGRRIEVRIESSAVTLASPEEAVMRIHIRWQVAMSPSARFVGDAWERSYGDLAWRAMEPERIMPWYFLSFDGKTTSGMGIKTGASALCFWQVDPAGISLWLDVRNGGRGVKLGTRELAVASIVQASYPEVKPFQAARQFCQLMCGHARMPAMPVYGGNNWYYAYGKSSAADIRADSERMASLADSSDNKPFMVIDDGWSPNPTAGPWSQGNERFPDMAELASDMRSIGVQPGLWMRPLFTKEEVPEGWRLRSPNAAVEYSARHEYTLDPTVPAVREKIKQDFRTAIGWGYALIKHDFSTYDLLGRWGFRMGDEITDANWGFADGTRTNAEVIRDFYSALREAAGSVMLLGCNTVGHLAAGLFELQRIGDDTSGRDWSRTRKMGVNTLAFRAAQHGSFFAVDADCVGLTKQIPWSLNREWLDLLARSGTPLFVSAAPDALGPEQRAAIQQAFALAAKPQPLAEPLDWMRDSEPEEWLVSGKRTHYDWFGSGSIDSGRAL